MQKLLSKTKNANIYKNELKNTLKVFELEKFYLKKTSNIPLYGLEYERISLDRNTLKTAKYSSVEKILIKFCEITKWNLVYDNETIIGAKNKGSSISLEPGCQLEISLEAKKDILEIDVELEKIISLLDKIALLYDVIFLGYGINPSSNVDEIELLNKKRYKIMDEYLPYCSYGELCPKMMRKTAGIQVNIDYGNKQDAYLKLKFFNLIMPFVSMFLANSPFENNKLSEIKSLRSYVWLYTGKNRCNFFYKNIFKSFFKDYNKIFKDYINEILNVPMIYIERDGEIIPIKGKINFAQFLKQGYKNYSAKMDDFVLHQSLCFPDVRLKNYIEIRNHDSSNPNVALALCAFYKGLCNFGAKKLIKEFSFLKVKNYDFYSKKLLNEGLDAKITFKYDGWDVIAKLFNIAKLNLTSKERIYLEPLFNMIKSRKTQADIIMDYDFKNVFDLVEFLY